jgi:hypothetical protein
MQRQFLMKQEPLFQRLDLRCGSDDRPADNWLWGRMSESFLGADGESAPF